jgi:hypothetical protein
MADRDTDRSPIREDVIRAAERRASAPRAGEDARSRYGRSIAVILLCALAALLGLLVAGLVGSTPFARRVAGSVDGMVSLVTSGNGPLVLIGIVVAIGVIAVYRSTRS